jgi:hypothetical protein
MEQVANQTRQIARKGFAGAKDEGKFWWKAPSSPYLRLICFPSTQLRLETRLNDKTFMIHLVIRLRISFF